MNTLKDFIINGSLELGFQLTENQIVKFLIYLSELKKWNRKINLTAIKDDKSIITKLFLESLTFLYGFKSEDTKRILDIGTGAGFPGIPIKIIHPEISFTLIDGSKKKVAFLKHICRQINLLDIECMAERAEAIAMVEKHKRDYDVILSKGVADMETLLRIASPLLKSKGLLITQKGGNIDEELKRAEQKLKNGEWVIKKLIEIDKPIFNRKFHLIIMQNLS